MDTFDFCLFSQQEIKTLKLHSVSFFFQKEPVFCSCSAEKDEKEEVIVHCKECKEDICQICYEAHLRLKMTKHHNFIWLNGNTEFVYKHEGSNKGIRIKVKSRNPQQAQCICQDSKPKLKWLFLKYQPSEDDLPSQNSFQIKIQTEKKTSYIYIRYH